MLNLLQSGIQPACPTTISDSSHLCKAPVAFSTQAPATYGRCSRPWLGNQMNGKTTNSTNLKHLYSLLACSIGQIDDLAPFLRRLPLQRICGSRSDWGLSVSCLSALQLPLDSLTIGLGLALGESQPAVIKVGHQSPRRNCYSSLKRSSGSNYPEL